ncbi:uncharacterized protein LOC136036160 isoform X2 [Artemia franciscana]|uniref:uncharacterized protein LOC136036160 isoform X2 n=1 Tax=Artemia franciscana TaxID=6661 RepID=UPI0032DA6619
MEAMTSEDVDKSTDISDDLKETPADQDLEPGYFFLLPCSVCGRNFKPDSLSRHQSVCEKNAQKKRPVFDSSKQRLQGTELQFSSPTSPSAPTKRSYSSLTPAKKRQSKWKEQHNDLIQSVRAAKGSAVPGLSALVIGPTFKKRSVNVFQSVPDDVTPCPHCERSFGIKSFDRHVDWCKEQRTRLPNSPTDQANEAKERLEARIRYRAPAPKKSLRDLTREKYSPTRTIPSSFFAPYGKSTGSLHSSLSGQDTKSYGGSQSSLNSKLSAAVSTGATSFSRASVATSEASSMRTENSQLSQERPVLAITNRSPSNLSSSFNRNTGSRYSVRSLPTQHKEPKRETTPTRAPFLAGAARSSFRTKTNSEPRQTRPLATQTLGRNVGTKARSLASPTLSRRVNYPARPTVLDLFSPGKRSEPEGVESMMSASCIQLDTRNKNSISLSNSGVKEERNKNFDFANQLKRKVKFACDFGSMFGTSFDESSQDDTGFSTTYDNPLLLRTSLSMEYLSNKNIQSMKNAYDPYLSAQKQMEELLDSVANYKFGAKSQADGDSNKVDQKDTSKDVRTTTEVKEDEQPVVATIVQTNSFPVLPERAEVPGRISRTPSSKGFTLQQKSLRSNYTSSFKIEDRLLSRKDSTDSEASMKRSTSIPRPIYSRSNSGVQDSEIQVGYRQPVVRSRSSQASKERVVLAESPSSFTNGVRKVDSSEKTPVTPKPVYPRTAAIFKQETPPNPPPRKSLMAKTSRKETLTLETQPGQKARSKLDNEVEGVHLDEDSRQRVAALEADLKQILSGISELGLISKHTFEKSNEEVEGRSPSKFCHSCGTPYPILSAKFCCTCGDKRLYC